MPEPANREDKLVWLKVQRVSGLCVPGGWKRTDCGNRRWVTRRVTRYVRNNTVALARFQIPYVSVLILGPTSSQLKRKQKIWREFCPLVSKAGKIIFVVWVTRVCSEEYKQLDFHFVSMGPWLEPTQWDYTELQTSLRVRSSQFCFYLLIINVSLSLTRFYLCIAKHVFTVTLLNIPLFDLSPPAERKQTAAHFYVKTWTQFYFGFKRNL